MKRINIAIDFYDDAGRAEIELHTIINGVAKEAGQLTIHKNTDDSKFEKFWSKIGTLIQAHIEEEKQFDTFGA